MPSICRNILVLALATAIGCQSVARPGPWQTRRVPSPAPTVIAPKAAPNRSTWKPTAPMDAGKRVPDPLPDPQSKRGGSTLPNKLNAQTIPPVAPGTEQPQLRFKPVLPRSSSEKEPTNGAAVGSRDVPGGETTLDELVSPPKIVLPKQRDDSPKSDTNQPTGPSLGFEALPPPNDAKLNDSAANDSPLSLEIKGHRQRPVGGTVTFDVVVRNDGAETLSNVLVNVEFEEALVFPGSEERRLKKSLGQLLPSQSREMRLTLTSNRLGQHECKFSVTADEIDPVKQTATVNFIDAKLQVRLIGPARRTVGSRAEFTVKVANTSEQPIDDLQVTLHHDAALTPHVATGGFQKEEHSLRWSLGRLEAGAGVQVQAEFDCQQLSEQACITAEARSEQLSAVAVEDCVTVVAVPGLLDLRVSDRTDPVRVGGDAEFEITVQNLSLEPVSDVQLDVQTSEHLQAGTHSAKLDGREVTLALANQDGTLRLTLPGSFPPDATLRITLHAKVLRPGDAELRVIAAVGTAGSLVETTEFTSINP